MAKRVQNNPFRLLGQSAEVSADWWKTNLEFWELLTASAVTIGIRLNRLGDFSTNGTRGKSCEMTGMVTEKGVALAASGAALPAIFETQTKVAKRMQQAWAGAFDPQAINKDPLQLTANLVGANLSAISAGFDAWSRLQRPYHRKSTSNAKRLSTRR